MPASFPNFGESRFSGSSQILAYQQALWGALAAGREKKGELATTSLEIEFHVQFLCGSPSTELSDFRQSARM